MESKHCVRAWHIKRGINYKVEGHKKKGAKESLSPYSLPLPFLHLSRRPAFYRILMDFTGSRVSSIEQTFITVLLIICETVMDSGVTNSIENLWTLLTIHFNHDRFSVSLSGAHNIPKSIFLNKSQLLSELPFSKLRGSFLSNDLALTVFFKNCFVYFWNCGQIKPASAKTGRIIYKINYSGHFLLYQKTTNEIETKDHFESKTPAYYY